MLSFRTSSARVASLIAGAILHLGYPGESGGGHENGWQNETKRGAPGGIRTCTVLLLRKPPPTVGLLARRYVDLVPHQRVHARLRCAQKRVHARLRRAQKRVHARLRRAMGHGSNTRPAAYQAALNQLSFGGGNEIWSPHHGIEPGTSCLQGKRSRQLSYAGMTNARSGMSRARM